MAKLVDDKGALIERVGPSHILMAIALLNLKRNGSRPAQTLMTLVKDVNVKKDIVSDVASSLSANDISRRAHSLLRDIYKNEDSVGDATLPPKLAAFKTDISGEAVLLGASLLLSSDDGAAKVRTLRKEIGAILDEPQAAVKYLSALVKEATLAEMSALLSSLVLELKSKCYVKKASSATDVEALYKSRQDDNGKGMPSNHNDEMVGFFSNHTITIDGVL